MSAANRQRTLEVRGARMTELGGKRTLAITAIRTVQNRKRRLAGRISRHHWLCAPVPMSDNELGRMTLAIVLGILTAGFGLSAYLYFIGGRRTCPRCGSRNAYVHLGRIPTGPFFNCRKCGAMFDGNGSMFDPET